jgi:hypothetical protein
MHILFLKYLNILPFERSIIYSFRWILYPYQLFGAGELVGVDGETDLLEEQEAELSADWEVSIGKEEIVVGDEEVAGQGE